MWYRIAPDTGEKMYGNHVICPDGFVLDDNHEDTHDGWYWSETQPDWLKELELPNLSALNNENE